MFQPNQAVVVHMGKDGRDGPPASAVEPRRLGSPSPRINVIEQSCFIRSLAAYVSSRASRILERATAFLDMDAPSRQSVPESGVGAAYKRYSKALDSVFHQPARLD